MRTDRRPLIALLGVAGLLAGVYGKIAAFSAPMPGYLTDMRAWAAQGWIGDTFTPLAYPLFGGLGYRLGGTAGLVAEQAILHVVLAMVAFVLLRQLRLPAWWAVGGALLLVVHPDLLSSVTKVWDASLSAVLLLLIALTLVRLLEAPFGMWNLLAAGAALGAGMSSRPNYLLLTPVLLWAVLRGDARTLPNRKGLGPRIGCALLLCGIAGVVFAGLGAMEHGRPFVPRNGPYNLYAGHNAFTANALLEHENAEPSIPLAYAATGRNLPDPGDYYGAQLEHFYSRESVHFAFAHMPVEIYLCALKLFTLFRADTKVHPLLSMEGVVKATLALPVILYAGLLCWVGWTRVQTADKALLGLAVLYVVPFLLTNADPRFRAPLDALLLLGIVRLYWVGRLSAA